jgi:hypothetical protein
MVTGTRSHPEPTLDAEPHEEPEISLCESRPGKSVLLESGNTDGWIASDMTVDVSR